MQSLMQTLRTRMSLVGSLMNGVCVCVCVLQPNWRRSNQLQRVGKGRGNIGRASFRGNWVESFFTPRKNRVKDVLVTYIPPGLTFYSCVLYPRTDMIVLFP